MKINETVLKPADSMVIAAAPPALEPVIEHSGWPSITPAHFRETMRLDGTVNAARARHVLTSAMLRVAADLTDWVNAQNELLGNETGNTFGNDAQTFNQLTEQDAPIDGRSWRIHHYESAVYCYACALLNERMANFDATHQGTQRSDDTIATTSTLQRDGLAHIRAIKGEPSSNSELL
jgi:hypothetical protein